MKNQCPRRTVDSQARPSTGAGWRGEPASPWRFIVAAIFLAFSSNAADRSWHFATDILPILTKAGCNAGKCHGAATGQGGFKLSLLGDDPSADHAAITRERGGRRIDFSVAARSLILRKPARELRHKGGVKLRAQSDDWKTVRDWIAGGAKFGDAKLTVTRIIINPPEWRASEAGAKHQMKLTVTAEFSNGTKREVTRHAVFTSQDDAVAAVDADGTVTALRPGVAPVMVRAMGQVTAMRVAVPFGNALKESFPKDRNYIDEAVFAELKQMRIPASAAASDHVFLRRATLVIAGRLPTAAEARAFLQKPDRAKLVERLLGSAEFVDYWTMKLGDLFLLDSKQLGLESARAYREWLHAQLQRNAPIDQLVRKLLTAKGNLAANPAANFQRRQSDPRDMGEFVSQSLLGIRLACARCHNHPFDRWTQADYYRFAAFFARTRVRDGALLLTPEAEVRHPRTDQLVEPANLNGVAAKGNGSDFRPALANWMTAPDNPFFARAFVNRVWLELMGRGIVEPVDDLRVSNPPTNPALLNALVKRFVESKFDLRRLIRDITASHVFGSASKAKEANREDNKLFSRYPITRLDGPVLADAFAQVTGQPDDYEGYPRGTRAVQLLDARVPSFTLDVFGRCPRTGDNAGQRGGGLRCALHLINSPELNAKLKPAVEALLKGGQKTNAIIDELYLRTLARFPEEKERALMLGHIKQVKNKDEGWRDLLWALMNSREFLFNH